MKSRHIYRTTATAYLGEGRPPGDANRGWMAGSYEVKAVTARARRGVRGIWAPVCIPRRARTALMNGPPIRTVGLRKTFNSGRGKIRAVDGVDLEISEGQFFGLLGPNGAGKSTIVGMLTTRVLPTSGHATIYSIDVLSSPEKVKRLLGVAPQTNTLDQLLTVAENLEFHCRYYGFPRREARQRTHELLQQFHLTERADAMVSDLSGGLAQRLTVARALAHRPLVLFLDEPTSGIDPQSRINLWDILRDLHRNGQTIFLTTHYLEEADALCERIAIIDKGRILADDSPYALKHSISPDDVLTVVYDGDAASIASSVRSLSGIRRVEHDGNTLRVVASDMGQLIDHLVEIGASAGRRVRDVTSVSPSLESVFLNLTGREYRE
jgi:ABC-2 type transport system ATP-binding protein